MSPELTRKQEIAENFGKHEKDTGSSEVQVALLTEKIRELTDHMKKHRHDFRSQRSLRIKVSQRQKHLKYLKRTDPEKYREVVEKLNLRK
mgnify:CR=1 FL=1